MQQDTRLTNGVEAPEEADIHDISTPNCTANAIYSCIAQFSKCSGEHNGLKDCYLFGDFCGVVEWLHKEQA